MNGTIEPQISWDEAIQMVEQELQREFRGYHIHETIHAVARETVTEFVVEDVQAMTFVPVLAGRPPASG